MEARQFSVIIPAFNCVTFISRSIQSVLQQTYSNIECIVVDDGSTDGTDEVIRGEVALDPRVKFLRKRNGGVSSARNCGLAAMTGDFFCFLDADDFLDVQLLEKANVMLALDPSIDILQYGFREIDAHGNIRQIWQIQEYDSHRLHARIHSGSLFGSVWTKIIKSSAYNKNPIRFREQLTYGEDVLFSFELLRQDTLKVSYLHNSFYNYLQNPSSVSKNLKISSLESERAVISVMEELKSEETPGLMQSILMQKFNFKKYYLTDILGARDYSKFREVYPEVNFWVLRTTYPFFLKIAMLLVILHLEVIVDVAYQFSRKTK